MLPRVLVVASEEALAERLVRVLTSLDALTRTSPLDLRIVERVAREGYDIVIFGGHGFAEAEASITALRGLPNPPEFLVVSDSPSVEDAAAALAAGSLGVLIRELADEELHTALATLIERARTLREVVTELELQTGTSEALVVASPSMKRLVDTARRAAKATSTVLITGETGVGKECIAQLVHAQSGRAEGPFIALNCAAIPAELVESELFGHERGAFTGAHQSRRGYFELAHGGTLFLDEVTELPLAAQAKLLRVLQDKQLRPVGSARLIPVDVRLVAASNREVEVEVEAGRFRADLFYRLRVIELEIPPLRERPEDLEELLDVQLRHFNAVLGRDIAGISPAAREVLASYAWPGNVRELINVVERAVLLCLGNEIVLEDLPRTFASSRPRPEASVAAPYSGSGLGMPAAWLRMPWRAVRESLLCEGERIYLSNLLRSTGGRVGMTAKRAGIAERSLFEKMKRHGLRKEDFRPPPRSDSGDAFE